MALQQHELKSLAIELATAMPPPRSKTLGEVMADAMELNEADQQVIEGFLRAARTAGLKMDPDSVRRTDAADLRALWALK
ncbi:hypothetical protein GCM10027084_02380 [Pseudoxanthomonas sangjuensis]|uniref:hypothetical protein n=1 Tax=Pseudoxanthomonas sangjuensis TaxID=1503750 RepID=UPI001391CA80|nr:hypothetical protein [Pseudoxanthomonas sangjuensis]KAF1713877.1 hypothetical protein CSC71_05735 [Pseudoxanthomonas sangjuensis]